MLSGRLGHARAVIVTVVDDEMDAARKEFKTVVEVEQSGYYCCEESENGVYPVLLTKSIDRSNMPAMKTVEDALGLWRPEYIILTGIAGGIARLDETTGKMDGPEAGDVVFVNYAHYAAYVKRVDGSRLPRFFPLNQPDSILVARHYDALRYMDWAAELPVTRPDGEIRPPNAHLGEMVSHEILAGDGRTPEQIDVLNDYDHALAWDMESAGVARGVHHGSDTVHYRPSWFGVRGVSDRVAATPQAQEMISSGNDEERKLWRPYASAAAARYARCLVERLLSNERPPADGDPGAPCWKRGGD